MPRLLLVDDNPSIHRIAESLLAPTDVELVCVDSAAEALDRLGRGERFDVALVDTAMPGMDGWTLLERLRSMEETALMPIALMAGVLDPVDPAKLAKAPVQGFLKKPIELRELGDRVKALLATPVAPPDPSPFSTLPATSGKDLLAHAEAELLSEPAEASVGLLDEVLSLDEPAEDLLILTAEDLWPEEAALASEPVAAVLPDVHLDLEELDLDSLQDLEGELPPMPELAAPSPVAAPQEPAMPDAPEEEAFVSLADLADLDGVDAPPEAPLAEAPAPDHALELDDFNDLPASASLIDEDELLAWEVPEPGPAAGPEPSLAVAMAAPAPAPPAPMALPAAAGGQDPAVPGQPAPAAAGQAEVPSEQTRALIQALMADPVLMDALAKTVVARLGDQVLREIAWEVMPDLAGRLQQ